MSLLTTTTTAAYEYRTGSELPLYALKRRKAQKQCGFRAKSTYGHCIKDKVLIDPPYNTGNDFIYNDDFKVSSEEYADESGEVDEEGNRMFKNTDSNGRFHSDWCSMIYSRLMLARNLLSEDGLIFISIDEHESHNLRKICDEVFGLENFISPIVWEKRYTRSNNAKRFTTLTEPVICYAKSLVLHAFLWDKNNNI